MITSKSAQPHARHAKVDEEMKYTIGDFWVPRLGMSSSAPSDYPLVKGWSFLPEGLPTFREAPLALSVDEFGVDVDPMKGSLILVSAPGAVGKSTLARQIAHSTGSVYVDLSVADPVGANTLSGGLLRGKIAPLWADEKITALIDGLDEAKLKTTEGGFKAFLSDVAEMAKDRNVPVVLFGRTRTIQDAWLHLVDEVEGDVTVFEIGYFEREASIDFAAAALKDKHPDRGHPGVDRKALELLIDNLRAQTERDDNRFAGYAPVLQSVSERVAEESNPNTIVSELQRGDTTSQAVTLQSVTSDILAREQGKLVKRLSFDDANLAERLYSPDEQLQRLVARVHNLPYTNWELPRMSPRDARTYSDALKTWVGEHPFLDGDTRTSTVVFDAMVAAKALKNEASASIALSREIEKRDAANPFLYIFYDLSETVPVKLSGEHVGVVYASIMASLAQGETASLHVEESDDSEAKALGLDGEIEVTRRGISPKVFRFNIQAGEVIQLGAYVKDAVVIAPNARVKIGGNSEMLLVAPVNIECDDLMVLADGVIAENRPGSRDAAVLLKANSFSGNPTANVPVTRNGAELFAIWPNSDRYPWTSFATTPSSSPVDDPQLDEALRRFRKFVVEFRAHGNGGLARSRNKIESGRMTKGTGQSVIDLMLSEGIVTRDQARYYLDSNRLAELTEATYADFMAYQYGPRIIDFVRKALQ